jgi:hypothetical protein
MENCPVDSSNMEILMYLGREIPPDALEWNAIRNRGSTVSDPHTGYDMDEWMSLNIHLNKSVWSVSWSSSSTPPPPQEKSIHNLPKNTSPSNFPSPVHWPRDRFHGQSPSVCTVNPSVSDPFKGFTPKTRKRTRTIHSLTPVRGLTRPSIPPSFHWCEENWSQTFFPEPWIFFLFLQGPVRFIPPHTDNERKIFEDATGRNIGPPTRGK